MIVLVTIGMSQSQDYGVKYHQTLCKQQGYVCLVTIQQVSQTQVTKPGSWQQGEGGRVVQA